MSNAVLTLVMVLTSTLYLAAPAAAQWTVTGTMNQSRVIHTATVLQDGRVLVTGGCGDAGCQHRRTAELYDPTTGSWQFTGSMIGFRQQHTATLLNNGKVLVVGGYGDSSTSELYDPAAGSFGGRVFLVQGRQEQNATLLPTGQVMVSGGFLCCNTPRSSIEFYDPDTNSWSLGGPMTVARSTHTATLLTDGTILIAGGFSDPTTAAPVASAEIFDPATGISRPTLGSMALARRNHTATMLPDGRVLIAGGLAGATPTPSDSAEIYDPATGIFQLLLSNMSAPHGRHVGTEGAVSLPDGRVLLAGGFVEAPPNSATDLFDPATQNFTPADDMHNSRGQHTTVFVPALGQVLVAGGHSGADFVTAAELFALVISVSIDIKPGSFPNSINLGSGGTVPVAILSTGTFDATTVDPVTVTLASAPVKLKGKGTPMTSVEDVNGDGLGDLVVHVDTSALELTETDTEAVLEGKTIDGTMIRGTDSVRVVP